MSAVLDAALGYTRRGWRVTPSCNPAPDGTCGCGRKTPHTGPAIGKATILPGDKQLIEAARVFRQKPDANVALLLEASSLISVDCDGAAATMEATAKGLPPTATLTSRPGHEASIYALPPGVLPANSSGRLIRTGASGKIDILARGIQILPPAVHRTGSAYTWLPGRGPDEVPVAPAPPWVIDALVNAPARASATATPLPDDLPPVDLATLDVDEDIRELIRDGGDRTDRSRDLFRVELALIDADCDDATIASLLLDPANGISAKPREQGRTWLAAEIARVREKHARPVETIDDEPAAGDTTKQTNDSGEEPRRHRRFLNDLESLALPDIAWLLGDVLPVRNIAFLVAAAGSCKTFVAVDMAFCVATGSPWLGCPVQQGPVVYVEAEGDPEFKYRLLAWKREHHVEGEICGVEFLYEAVDLTNGESVEEFTTDLRALPEPPVLVVLDTLACCLGDGDENSATDMRVAIDSMKRIRREFGCTVLATHHTGHANPDRARGSSAFLGAADTILSLKKDDDVLRLTCGKRRGAPFEEIAARLVSREVGGQTAAVVKPAGAGAFTGPALSANQRSALQTLADRLDEEGFTYSEWRRRVDLAESTFDRVVGVLMGEGYVTKDGSGRGARYADTAKGRATITPTHPHITPSGVNGGDHQSPPSPPPPYKGGGVGVMVGGNKRGFDPLDPECVEGVQNSTPGEADAVGDDTPPTEDDDMPDTLEGVADRPIFPSILESPELKALLAAALARHKARAQ